MKKVLWLSRHPMTELQLEDLKKFLGCDVCVETENVLWNATEDWLADHNANCSLWETKALQADVICGVIPPVALEALLTSRLEMEVYSPVSKQEKKVREDGNAQIGFVHLRWCRIH